MLIGFSDNTTKIIPRIFCGAPRHCAPIIQIDKNHFIMFQFVRRGNVAQIALNGRELKLLQSYGWQFIKILHTKYIPPMQIAHRAISCVDLCKRTLNIHAPFILTPKGLLKKLKRP